MIIPLFGLGQKSKSVTVSAQRHLNLYAEVTMDADKTPLAFYGTPGLNLFTSFGDTPVRGSIAVGDFLYVVHRGTFYEVNNAGIKVSRGILNTTSSRVSLSYNGLQIGIVDGLNMYMYNLTTLAFAIVTSGLMARPIDITFQDHFFIASFFNSGIFQLSAIDDGTTWNALDFASAESNPDNLIRCIADHGEIVLCGTNTIEFWGNTGALDFPYANQRGSTLEFGVAAPYSLVKYNDSLAGLMKNQMGQVQVMILRGHALQKISTTDIDSIVNDYATVSDATAFAYLLGGHPMYEINFPSANQSWLYDFNTNLWTELQSNGNRHLAEICTDYINNPRVSDYANGNIYTLDQNSYTENGVSITREIQARHYFTNYSKLRVIKMQVDFETGIGLSSGQGINPQVMLQISRDNGHTWGNELWVSLGAIGKYLTRAIWWRLGFARDFVFKLRITDPVKVVIAGASIYSAPSDEQ